MKRTLFTLALLAAASQALASSVYRCVVDGETIFSQAPCAADAAEHKVWGSRSPSAPRERTPPMTAGEIAALSAPQASALIAGVVTHAEVLAQNCERDMYVKNTVLPCIEFIAFLGGSQWENGLSAANHLSDNHPGYNDSNLRRANSRMETVQRVRAAFDAKYSN